MFSVKKPQITKKEKRGKSLRVQGLQLPGEAKPTTEAAESSLFSKKRADEEPVDPKKYLEESCKPKCVRYLRAYEACENRVKEDETGHKHCTGQYFDYWSCVDKCVAPRLFTKLK
ncbi:hypothetical protein AAG906_000741 [Vitis piasezkii]